LWKRFQTDGSTMVTGISLSAIAASMAPTARPYLKPLLLPCFGSAWARSRKACWTSCLLIHARIAIASTRSLAFVPITGMSIASTSRGAAPSSMATTANPPRIPGRRQDITLIP
jgi:hypothetical protein